jgi:Tol biopolymer transport system component
MRPPLLALLAFLAVAPAADAARGTVVFVCGQDLCRAGGDGKAQKRLTRDGARAGGYSRPSLSADGRRLAYRRGDRPPRVYTARLTRRGLSGARQIGPAPDGPRDATQYDVAISRDGRRVAWVEHRINVVNFPSSSIDYRRYMANVDGSGIRQVAGSGGRPFVAFYDATRIMREGITDAFENRPDATTVDQGLCVPEPESEQNGTCGDNGPQTAFDPAGRHLRHPARSPDGRLVVAAAYQTDESIDNAPDHAGALVLFGADALPARQLTPGPNDGYASFSPDGRNVIFERNGVISTVSVRGGAVRRLLRGRQPTWGR